MEIKSSKSLLEKPTVNLLVYGHPGVGKTTFAVSGVEKVLIADAESGSNYLGLRDVECDIARLSAWEDLSEVYRAVKDNRYSTVVLDPLGELLDKLITKLKREGYATSKGDALSLQGWGVAKDKFKEMVRSFRDLNVNLVLVAHSAESKDEDNTLIRPKLQAKLDEDVCAMMDVVGYLRSVKVDKDKSVRRIYLQPDERFYAKDRTGLLPETLDNSNFGAILEKIQNNPVFKKSQELEQSNQKKLEEFTKDMGIKL